MRDRLLGLACLLVCGVTSYAVSTASKPFVHFEHNRDAFARPVPALTAAQLRVFNFGNRLFNTNWTQAPASSVGFDGLGPSFNRVSCSGCHTRDGRGRPPIAGETELQSMLIRISVPGTDAHGAPKAVPGYGTQIQDRAIPQVPVEARITVTWTEFPGRYADGERYSLRKPNFRLQNPGFGDFPKNLLSSARVAPAVFGAGLLEAVPEASLIALADPDDSNRDGISGRINWVWSPLHRRLALGRFGWKAGMPNLIEQNAGAAHADIGLTSPIHPKNNCPAVQTACARAPHGGEPELSQEFLEKLTQYVQMLAVPSQRAVNQLGAKQFQDFGCGACHKPTLKTGESEFSFLHQQSFSAYTDLLLHDMGPGLADQRPEFLANGREWRTAPLWGLGLIEVVNGHQLLLHDGRARGVAEAILWHGGEAEAAKERFRRASRSERKALVEFLNAL